MIKTLSLLFVSGAIALVACSSSKNSTDTGGACASYVAALRDSAKRCKNNNASPEQDAAALARRATLCTNQLNAPGNGVTASAVQACGDAQRSTCDTPDACDALSSIVGSLPDGTACGADGQCAGGDCRKDSASTGTGCGKCAQRIAIGGTCGADGAKCVRGASCATKGGTGTCIASVKVAEGEVCYDSTKPSSSYASCASGLTCKIGSTTGTPAPVKCVKRSAAGEACTQEGDCLTELSCIAGKCAALLAEGGACTSSSNCAVGACSRTTKKCVPSEFVAAGATCDDEALRCARGRCERGTDGTTGKCVDPIADGAPCTATSSGSGPRCDTYATCINGTCQLFDPASCK